MPYAANRFGQDSPARIAASTSLLLESSAYLPGEPYVPELIPFYPPDIVSGSGASSTALTADGHPIWQRTPSQVDLLFWQGDDVVIPLYFNDPMVLSDDMAANYRWVAQIREWHSYKAPLVNDFATHAEYHASEQVPPSEDDEYTMVELFLPRMYNTCSGLFRWELYSISPEDYSRFPMPAHPIEPPEPGPVDTLRTWLFGNCTIMPRGSTTDFLPAPPPQSNGSAGVLSNGGWFVGPNGRVP